MLEAGVFGLDFEPVLPADVEQPDVVPGDRVVVVLVSEVLLRGVVALAADYQQILVFEVEHPVGAAGRRLNDCF